MKVCTECHADQTLTLNPPLQSHMFVMGELRKKINPGKDFEERWEEVET